MLPAPAGDSQFVRTTADARYYHPLFFDNVVGIIHLQGGDIFGYGSQPLRITDNFNLGPSLVRGFAPGGIGPRDISDPYNTDANSLGGTKYVGASAEVQFPILGLPKEIGLKGAVFADAGTLFGYEGQTNFSNAVRSCRRTAPASAALWMNGSTIVPRGHGWRRARQPGNLHRSAGFERDPFVGRRRPPVGFAARADPLQLCLRPYEGTGRRDPGIQLLGWFDVLTRSRAQPARSRPAAAVHSSAGPRSLPGAVLATL